MNRIILCILICTLCSLHLKSADDIGQSNDYEITGKITGIPEGTIFFLVKNGGKDTVSSTQLKNSIFKFSGTMERQGELYFIKLDTTNLRLEKGKKSYVRLLLDHSKIKVSGTFETWPKVRIEGSKATESFEILFAEVKKLTNNTEEKCNQLSREFKDVEKKQRIAAEIKRHYGELYKIFVKNKNSLATPFLVYNYAPDSIAYIQSIYNTFPAKIRNGYYASCLINERIPIITARSQTKVGNQIPHISSLLDMEGNPVSIMSIAAKGKVTLIDFWASWCYPCRAQMAELKKIYAEYHPRGFNIISISQDEKKEAWLKAIKDENVEWFNAIDSKKVTSDLFALVGIPAYMLIDEKGKMIAFLAVSSVPSFGPSLNAKDLSKTLDKILTNQ